MLFWADSFENEMKYWGSVSVFLIKGKDYNNDRKVSVNYTHNISAEWTIWEEL